jgi:hypothetical protein
MGHSQQDLRAATDQMVGMLQRLEAIERAKQETRLGSDELIELAVEAERLSRVVFRWAGLQLDMAHASRIEVELGGMERVRIIDVQARPLDRILANWREAQLRLEIAAPGTPEAASAADDVERLREEYHDVQADKFQVNASDAEGVAMR